MGRATTWISHRSVAVSAAIGLLLAGLVGPTAAGAHPDPGHGHEDEARSFPSFSPSEAADPPEGTVSLGDPTLSWAGQYYPVGSSAFAGTTCQVPSDLVCDHFALTVDVDPSHWETHSGGVEIVITWPDPANDFDLHVFERETGDNVGSSIDVNPDTGVAREEVFVAGASGVYDIVVNPFSVIDSAYDGEVALLSEEGEPEAGVPTERLTDVPCVDGMAGPFECDGVDLLSFVPQEEFDGEGVSDIWGWTDPENGDEYVFFGKTNGTAFYRVTDPVNPVYLGELANPGLLQGIWHDMKVFQNHVFIVSESEPHGMQVFDLTRLRGVTEPQEWTRDAWYRLNDAAHNVAINEDTGFAYIVGGNEAIVAPDHCLSGLHMVDIRTPKNPTFAGCYLMDGGPGTAARFIGAEEVSPAAYVHDTECVIYEGPDERYTGREICFNASEDQVTIADVTNKLLPTTVGVTDYPNVSYAHQGWLSDDQRFLFVNDELDEETHGFNTRTIVLDVSDLENPKLHFEHFAEVPSIDHNNYVDDGLLYQSNYTSGLRVLNTAHVDDPQNPRLEQVAFFDTYPATDDPIFEGTWSNYPFFESGTIAVTGIGEGLFLLRLSDELLQPAVDIACVNCPIQMRAGGRRSAAMAVTNLGLVDDAYRLSVADVPAGWTVRIQRAPLAVEAGEIKRVPVRIQVPAGAAPGTYDFIVTATSTVDPAVSASEQVDVIVAGQP